MLKKYPFFLILLPSFFCLHAAVENFGVLRLNDLLKLTAVILFVIAIMFLLINSIFKNKEVTAIVSLYISTWYLFFGAIHDNLKAIPNLLWVQRYSFLLPFFFLTSIALLIFLKSRRFNLSRLFLFFNILLFIYCIIDIFSLVKKNIYFKNVQEENIITFKDELVKNKPNVYFMLFDGYPGYESLKDSFSFRNDSFYHFLGVSRFKILPSVSNYNYTYFSMASMFNLDYLQNTELNMQITTDNFKKRTSEIKNAKLFSIFKRMNYSIKNCSLFDLKNNPGVGYYFTLNIGNAQLVTDKMFHSRFIKNVGWVFVTGKFSIPFLKNKYNNEPNIYNKEVEKGFEIALSNKSNTPQFIYLHFLLPHYPYYYNENGVLDNEASFLDESTFGDKAKFLEYLKYTNNKIKKIVNQITQQDSTGIIVLMSDHGFRDYIKSENKLIPPVFDNFCAVRFADNNYLPFKNKSSGVNFFRYLFNCEFNQNFSYLKDTSFFLQSVSEKK